MTPFIIGLTGSIGMGKSTTAKFFASYQDVALWDADAAVHRLYRQGGAAVGPIQGRWPGCIKNDAVDRNALKALIKDDPQVLDQLETIVHPLVQQDRTAFIAECEQSICVLDIPLLFETGAETQMDLVVVVSIDAEEQRRRVMERPGMTEQHFQRILQSQVPDAEKRKRADVVIQTVSLAAVKKQVDDLLDRIRGGEHA